MNYRLQGENHHGSLLTGARPESPAGAPPEILPDHRIITALRNWADRHSRTLAIGLEVLLLSVVIAVAARQLWCSPEAALGRQQESNKYIVGAYNLYHSGRYELLINHRAYPGIGSLGYALLLVPSYWLFGPNLANAIYSQLALALFVCLSLYAVLRICFGKWAAVFSVLLVSLYRSFSEYSHMNDTNIGVAFFLMAGVLVYLWILDFGRPACYKWVIWGACAGWAVATRSGDIAIIFCTLTLCLLWMVRKKSGRTSGRVLAIILGSLPFELPCLWYNWHYCGSVFRDLRCYWCSKPFDNLRLTFAIHWPPSWPDYAIGDTGSGNYVWFYCREILMQFHKGLEPGISQFEQIQVYCLSGMLLLGVVSGVSRARHNPRLRHLLLFTVITILSVLTVYSLFMGREYRFIVVLCPFIAGLVAMGCEVTIRWLARTKFRCMFILPLAFMLCSPLYRWSKEPSNNFGDSLPIAQLLLKTDALIEDNAVIIPSCGEFLTEVFLIRDTHRLQLPLFNYYVQPRPPKDPSLMLTNYPNNPLLNHQRYPNEVFNGAIPLYEFSVLENPERIQRLLFQQVPIYFFDHSYGNFISTAIILNQIFSLEPVAEYNPEGKLATFTHRGTFLYRLHPRGVSLISPSQ